MKKLFDTLPPEQVELRRLRKQFHKSLYEKMKSFHWSLTAKNIEYVKRLFLLKHLRVETSRALPAEQLREQIKFIRKLDKAWLKNFLMMNDINYNAAKLEKLTEKQEKKIVAIMKYSIKMNEQRQAAYIEETIGRKDIIKNLSVNEANQLIRRLERWEAKILTGKNF